MAARAYHRGSEPTVLRAPKTSDILVSELRALILSGGLEPGDALPTEQELVESFDASRHAVREALRLIESEGLVEIRRGVNGGPRVRRPSVAVVGTLVGQILTVERTPLRDFIKLRQVLEPAIAAAAAENITPEQEAHLLEILESERRTDIKRFRRRTTANFHSFIGRCSGNGVYAVLSDGLNPLYELHIRNENADEHVSASSQSAHAAISKSIIAGDAEAASRRMAKHLAGLEDYLARVGALDDPVVPRSSWSQGELR